ncbi:MAG: TusE/DsrC/DsvC family sulfur relay protein [Gammaproteobacteria bacterium]|nr:TusE/DsrC/DsvC family sulfur relay protein [Gammaproteobacteria bacterium]MBU1554018.1 TusE/DsrC/DsvC family sulfur relay protein [Gammaproteobacteria bacterium]MBU2069254.1 TusE/DsrC/DsvC family sulfur relay protein [Gammaproteobacteria bacterium]MBU2182151.1 TusE/DsrC/DsvC family sulfur relay protein [Gammaproteobacteria bacterium]MBU2206178.1 TusE/DsrC/DsvC family sulfur relay protein [Gammaproteobacteria bacterium]
MAELNYLQVDGKQLALDKHGYLSDLQLWDQQVALAFAARENIELSEAHWEVVHFVRQFYLEFNTSPAIRVLVKAMAQQLGADKGNSKYLFLLFPQGPAKQATRIAGLPKPAKCL